MIFDDFLTLSYLIVCKDVPKLVKIKMEVLYAMREINSYKATKSHLKTNSIKVLDQNCFSCVYRDTYG